MSRGIERAHVVTTPTDQKSLFERSPVGEKKQWVVLVAGAGIVVAITIGFFLLFFNRFAGIRDANGAGLGGYAMLMGRIPFRNWFSATPPLFPLENELWAWLFGTAVITQRIVGVFERAVLAVVLYLWLARLFRTSSAAFGAILAITVSAGDAADPISSYNHDTILWATLAGFLASICLDWKSKRSAPLASFFCGVAAGFCLCDKQTIGLGITVAVPTLVAASLWKTKGFRPASRFAVLFCAGWAVPVAAISYWLYSNGVLGQCIHQIFFAGPAAKGAGSPIDFLTRWIMVTVHMPDLPGFLMGAILLILALKRLFEPIRQATERKRNVRDLASVAVLSAVTIGAGVAAAYSGLHPWAPIVKASIYFTLLGCGLLAGLFSLAFVLGGLSETQRQFWLQVTVGFVCAFMLSLSWPAFEAMVIPGLGFLAAALLDQPSRRTRVACYAASTVLLFSLTVFKLWNPYRFDEWREPPVMSATVTPSLPALWGFRLPQAEVNMLDGAARIIREHSTPQDTIFTYPTMPIFYEISHRWSPGYAGDYNFDACPDYIARADALRVLKAKPAVIIYYRETHGFLKTAEMVWRNGKRAGQLDIIAAVDKLVKHYKLAASYDAPPTNLKVDVYVRH